MIEPAFTHGKWFVVFFEGREKGWWDIFTRPGFRHCYAMRYLATTDLWLVLDWANEGLFIDTVPKRYIDAMIVGVNDAGGCFLEINVQPRARRTLPLIPLYCVTAIKELVGIRDWRIFTPWQLYCALMKKGAKRMFDLSHFKENTDGLQQTQSTGTR